MKALILAFSIIAMVLFVSTTAAAQEPGFWTPAWVQAIGSVVAIFVAVGLGLWQSRQTSRQATTQRAHDAREDKMKAKAMASFKTHLQRIKSLQTTGRERINPHVER